MSTPGVAAELLLRVDAEPWDWTVATLPVLAGRLRMAPPQPTEDGHRLPLPDGTDVVVRVDRDGRPERLVVEVTAAGGMTTLTDEVARRLGPYVTARRGDMVTRWWRLPSGRRLEVVVTEPRPDAPPMILALVSPAAVPPDWVPLEVLADAAADLAVRIADAAFVPVEDESLPDMAASMGGRVAWSAPGLSERQIALPGPPFHLELVHPAVGESGLTWYTELRLDVYGAGDVPGMRRTAAYALCTEAVARRYGPATRPGAETTFWKRDNRWTVAVDRSSGIVRIRIRPPADEPVRPPE